MIRQNYDLSARNTLRLPARAQLWGEFSDVSELLTLLSSAAANDWPVRVLGGGSNVLLAGDIPGLVICPRMAGVQVLHQTAEFSWVAAEAGLSWHDWVVRSTAYGHGLENLALIPGTVGAAPVQNIGAYGAEAADFIDSVTGVQLSSRQLRTLSAAECRFAYRDSVFKRELARDFVITRVMFRLPRQFAPQLSYGPLATWSATAVVTPQSLIDEISRIRRSKLPDPQQIPNAGSFFKNPVVSAAQAAGLQREHPRLPCYPQAGGDVKLAAGWLIEQAGWKGRWSGHAGMHRDQALVLVTDGTAVYTDVERLQQQVQADVLSRFGVQLEPEPQLF